MDLLSLFILLLQMAFTGWLFYELNRLPGLLPSSGSTSVIILPVNPMELTDIPLGQLLDELYRRSPDEQKSRAGNHPETLHLIGCDELQDSRVHRLMREINLYLLHTHYTCPDESRIGQMIDSHLAAGLRRLRPFLFIPTLLGIFGQLLPAGSSAGNSWCFVFGLFSGSGLALIYLLRTDSLFLRAGSLTENLRNHLLLPVSHHLKDSVQLLRTELQQFGRKFASGIENLTSVSRQQMERICIVQEKQTQAICRETELLQEIRKMDFAQIVRFNTETLGKLKQTIDDFGLFTHLASSLGSLLQSMDNATANIEKGLRRTEQIAEIAEAVRDTVERNQQLQEFLTANMKVLADRKELVQHIIGGIDAELTSVFDQLHVHLEAKTAAIRDMVIKEQIQVEESIRAGKARFEKLERLDELVLSMTEIRHQNESSHSLFLRIAAELEKTNASLLVMNETIKKKRIF